MESQFLDNKHLLLHSLKQMAMACELIIEWNKPIHSIDDYVTSMEGMKTLAAVCMQIESIGEGIKKIDTRFPGFLSEYAPDIPWKSIKGMRDRIAHGYFNIDAEIVYDVAVNEVPILLKAFHGIIKDTNK